MAGSIHLDIAVVGAGIAGLAAAIALRRAGHNVTVYKRCDSISAVGAAIMMPPHAGTILKAWNFDKERAKGTILSKIRMLNVKTAKLVVSEELGDIDSMYGASFFSYHRSDLVCELVELATAAGAGIKFSHNVVDVDCSTARLDFADGTNRYADLIVIANGLYSGFVQKVSGSNLATQKSGYSAYRSLIDLRSLEATGGHEPLLELIEACGGKAEAMCGGMNSTQRTTCVIYPCKDGQLLNVVIVHPSAPNDVESEHWNSPADVEDAVRALDGFHPMFLKLVRAFNEVRSYSLGVREPIRRLVRDKVILVGDAAHPMLPLHAGGGSCALEDAASLEVILSNLPDKDNLSNHLRLWQALRLPRNSVIQILSNTSFLRSDQSTATVVDLIKPFYEPELPAILPPGWSRTTRGFFCSYNAFDAAKKALIWAAEESSLAELLETGKVPVTVVQHFGDAYIPPSENQEARDQTTRPGQRGCFSRLWI